MKIKADCLHFKGDKPCDFVLPCDESCNRFAPVGEEILIIKTGAQGDVLRTTAILPGLKRKYPTGRITWLVAGESAELLQNNPFVSCVLAFNLEDIILLFVRRFDILISLDKEAAPAALATKIASGRKFGFGMNEHGHLVPFNKASEYAYRLGLDNDLKFYKNKKTYQEIIHDIAGLEYEHDEYVFNLEEADRQKARDFFRSHRIPGEKPNIGLNTGAGTKFETKQWPEERFLELIALIQESEANIFLLGGEKERTLNETLKRKSERGLFNTGTGNTLREFAGFIDFMDVVVSSDSLAMHLAIALKKNIIALFGPTCPQEIDLYGRGTKVFAGVSCSPCYRQTCPDTVCMKDISAGRVFREIQKFI